MEKEIHTQAVLTYNIPRAIEWAVPSYFSLERALWRPGRTPSRRPEKSCVGKMSWTHHHWDPRGHSCRCHRRRRQLGSRDLRRMYVKTTIEKMYVTLAYWFDRRWKWGKNVCITKYDTTDGHTVKNVCMYVCMYVCAYRWMHSIRYKDYWSPTHIRIRRQ